MPATAHPVVTRPRLTTAPAKAPSVGYAFARRGTHSKYVRWGLPLLLAACAFTDLGFLIFRNPFTEG